MGADTGTGEGGAAGLDPAQLEHMRKIRRILRFLATDERLAHMDGRILVFGSAEAGKAVPGDVDAYFDFSDSKDSLQHPDAVQGTRLLLGVAAQFYGKFDPFVRVGKILYARNENCNGWVYAKQVRALRKAGEAGRHPLDVYEEIRSRPHELGGAPPPKDPAPEADAPAPGM